MSKKVDADETAIVPAENVLSSSEGEIKADSLIVIETLPVITEQLQSIKPVIEKKISNVLALDCNKNTVKAIKDLRSDLRADFENLEQRRKFVKSKVMEPYEDFNKVYKDCVTTLFEDADEKLKKRIDEVDEARKAEKRAEVETYFNELLQSKNIDFVTFADANINVTLNSSKKGLLEQAKAYIDRISDDLKLIDTQEYKEEILVEYKKSLNASSAITTVCDRHKAIEAEKVKKEQAEQIEAERRAAVDKVKVAAAEDAPLSTPKTVEADRVIIMKLGTTRIKAKKSDCIILKNLLSNGRYEILK